MYSGYEADDNIPAQYRERELFVAQCYGNSEHGLEQL